MLSPVITSAISELAASKFSTTIAAAMHSEIIQIWELPSWTKICEFPTVFCMGAKNLALSPFGETLVAGLSRNSGKVAAYDVRSGRQMWEQRFLYPSSLRFHPSGQSLLCTKNNRSVLRLDAQTGKGMEVIDGVADYIEGSFGDEFVVSVGTGEKPIRIVGGVRNFSFNKSGFALLDAQFSPHFVCVSEARGLVRCINLIDGTLRWTFNPGKERHILKLHYSTAMNQIYGILWNFEKGGRRKLIRFDCTTGLEQQLCELDSWAEVFLDSSDQLITSGGEIRALADGALVGRLAFPENQRSLHKR